jgi:hypothetical protein
VPRTPDAITQLIHRSSLWKKRATLPLPFAKYRKQMVAAPLPIRARFNILLAKARGDLVFDGWVKNSALHFGRNALGRVGALRSALTGLRWGDLLQRVVG